VNYGYLALVIPGLAATSAGFIILGRKRFRSFAAGMLFVIGFAMLVSGILLTCVPDFFKG
jgi:hypothetical protein